MDQVTAVVETIHEGNLRVLTTRYLSECGCEWVVDMWGNVRRVVICRRDRDDIRELNQLQLELTAPVHEPGLDTAFKLVEDPDPRGANQEG